jgi:hypothetical protein
MGKCQACEKERIPNKYAHLFERETQIKKVALALFEQCKSEGLCVKEVEQVANMLVNFAHYHSVLR